MKALPLRRRFLRLVCALLAVMAQAYPPEALAQGKTAQPASPAKPEPAQQAQPVQPASVLPETVLMLVRSTLLSLNDALRTGNYTVLRDLGTPSFREGNSAGRLHQIFGSIAVRGVDLSAVAILIPQMKSPPTITPDRRLHIAGYFPGEPVRIDFELIFEAVGGQWRIYALSAAPVEVAAGNSREPEVSSGEGKKKHLDAAKK